MFLLKGVPPFGRCRSHSNGHARHLEKPPLCEAVTSKRYFFFLFCFRLLNKNNAHMSRSLMGLRANCSELTNRSGVRWISEVVTRCSFVQLGGDNTSPNWASPNANSVWTPLFDFLSTGSSNQQSAVFAMARPRNSHMAVSPGYFEALLLVSRHGLKLNNNCRVSVNPLAMSAGADVLRLFTRILRDSLAQRTNSNPKRRLGKTSRF